MSRNRQLCSRSQKVRNCLKLSQKVDQKLQVTGNNGEAAFKGGSTKTSTNKSFHPGEHKRALSENEKLKKLLGERELEIEILKDLLKKTNPTLADKVAIARKWIALGYKTTVVLRILGVSRSTYYYHLRGQHRTRRGGGRPISGYSFDDKGQRINDDQIKEWLLQLIQGEGNAYGYRKLTIALRRNFGLVINQKKVYRLCRELQIL